MFDSLKAATVSMDSDLVRVQLFKMRGRQLTNSMSKRIFDAALAIAIIVALLPAFLLIAVLIKLDSCGPVFFLQRRTGLNGEVFNIFKFRSMTVAEDGEHVVQAKQNDQRVTRVGRILRRSSLDEIPQIINILLGHMSFVGPRPHAMAHDGQFAAIIPDYNQRFNARPGLTGLAQVRGLRGEIYTNGDLEKRIVSDLEYIENWSFSKDIIIILKTVPVVFGHKNAY